MKYFKRKNEAFAINTASCRSELETILYVVEKAGYQTVGCGGDLYWFGLKIDEKDIKVVKQKKCFYNRYPGMEFLARKKVFCAINNRARHTFP